jgi:hypothetical protein
LEMTYHLSDLKRELKHTKGNMYLPLVYL